MAGGRQRPKRGRRIRQGPSQASASSDISQRVFHHQANPLRGPVRLGDPWVTKSRISCAKRCMTTFDNCTSFLFHAPTGLCTPGWYTNDHQPVPTQADGDFYQSFHCDTDQGFSVLTYGDTIACLGLFGPANYLDANADCQSKGSFLASVKTPEKYDLLYYNISDGTNLWIGCDDMAEEGKFVWKEDGQAVTTNERGSVFDSADPSADDQAEDCVSFPAASDGLADSDCLLSQKYVCEMPYL